MTKAELIALVATQAGTSFVFGYLGGAATTLGLDNFSGLSGWIDSYAPPAGGAGTWFTNGYGSTATGSVCAEGVTTKNASTRSNLPSPIWLNAWKPKAGSTAGTS